MLHCFEKIQLSFNRPLFCPSQEHQGQRRRRRGRGAPREPRLHPAVPACAGQGADPVPHHLHRGHRSGHHHAGPRLAGGRHRPGPGLPESGRPQNSRAGGQNHPSGPGTGIHSTEGKLTLWEVVYDETDVCLDEAGALGSLFRPTGAFPELLYLKPISCCKTESAVGKNAALKRSILSGGKKRPPT